MRLWDEFVHPRIDSLEVIHMRKKSGLVTGTAAALAMGVLILDAGTAVSGARTGIQLCLQTVIPSLFPFFVVSILLTGSIAGRAIPALHPLGRLCGIPQGTEALLLTGLLGGYPVGAQAVTAAYRVGQLTKRDAQRMLGFCSNAGPAFLFGMLLPMFDNKEAVWILWGIHILSALLTAMLLPGKSSGSVCLRSGSGVSLPQALERAVKVMAGVCGWVVIFRILIAVIQRWFLWLFPRTGQIAIVGLLELSNGCLELMSIPSQGLRFLLCGVFIGLGGLCVTMQTVSVTGELGLGMYLPGKILQAGFTAALCGVCQMFLFPAQERFALPWPAVLALSLGALAVFARIKNSSRKIQEVGV